jgi:UDP-N-acetyl-2-amino-2-deoxyglucuronate dehydrogenase
MAGGDPRAPFRFGLIGAGVAGGIHAAAMRAVPGVQVVAVTDADPARARALAGQHGIPEVYESGEALAARAPVDAVAVLTPHHLHLPMVRAAARAGRHVLVEKALAHTVAAADELIAECRTHGVTLAGVFQNRFTPAAWQLRDAVQGGALGRIVLASATAVEHRPPRYYGDAPWRGRTAEAGGGVLMIQAIHMIDLLHWVLGMPRRALGRIQTAVHAVEVEDVAVGLLDFDGGAVAAVRATTAALQAEPPSVEIVGARGTAVVSGSWGYLDFALRRGDAKGDPSPAARRVDPEAWPASPSVAPYAEQIADFVTAVREGRPPLVDGAEARKALVIVDALYRSARAGRWVELDA